MVEYFPYVDEHKKIKELFKIIKDTKVPARFTEEHLSTILGFKSSSNNLYVKLLKNLGFIDQQNEPTSVYWEYRDDDKSRFIIVKQIKKAYARLFKKNKNAYQLDKEKLQSKLVYMLGASRDDEIIPKIVSTFKELCKLGEFEKKTTEPMPRFGKIALILHFLVFVPMVLYYFIIFWSLSNIESSPGYDLYIPIAGIKIVSLTNEIRLLLLVVLSGVLGAFIHVGTSLVFFEGKGELKKNFFAWYLLRPFLGAALAPIVYFVFRGLFLKAGTSIDDINLYGIVAIAGLSGMFSKQVIEMLKKVANELFAKLENIEEEENK